MIISLLLHYFKSYQSTEVKIQSATRRAAQDGTEF